MVVAIGWSFVKISSTISIFPFFKAARPKRLASLPTTVAARFGYPNLRMVKRLSSGLTCMVVHYVASQATGFLPGRRDRFVNWLLPRSYAGAAYEPLRFMPRA